MLVDALWITGRNKIEVLKHEIDDEPEYDQVQVEIKACGVCAWDGALFTGVTSAGGPFPFLHGHEGVGYVRKVGAGVKNLKVGDFVMCAEDTPQMMQVQNINKSAVAKVHTEIKESEIPQWVGEPIVCVVNSLANMHIKPGAIVALIGAGYMGLLLIQALQKQLIGDLIVFDLDDKRLELAKKYGADLSVRTDSQAAKDVLEKLHSTDGAEIVFECSGSEAGLNLANNLMKTSGTLNLFAWHRQARMIDMTPWHQRGYTILNTAPNFDRHYRDHIEETEVLMRKGFFNQHDLITHVMPYHNAQEMMEISTNKSDGYIKGVITF